MEFAGTHYGAVSIAIICFTILFAISAIAFLVVFLSKKYKNIEVEKGKVKLDGTNGTNSQNGKNTTLSMTIIREYDWKNFVTELYEFCIVLMKPSQNCMYSILHCFDNDISPSKKMYVERFLYFNHIPEKDTKQYKEYIGTHTNALIQSVCRSIKFICSEYDKETGEFNAEKLEKSLSNLIEKYRGGNV